MFNGIRALFSRLFSSGNGSNSGTPAVPQMNVQPYKDAVTNLTYNSLFCDDVRFFRNNGRSDGPWKILTSKNAKDDSLKSIAENAATETSARLLAYNTLRSRGIINPKEVLGVVVEVGAVAGPDVLAIYSDMRARYINEAGRVYISESNTPEVREKMQNILKLSQKIIAKAEPWDEGRPSAPPESQYHITFLAADGIYTGQGSMAELGNDQFASALINASGDLMVILVNKNNTNKAANTNQKVS